MITILSGCYLLPLAIAVILLLLPKNAQSAPKWLALLATSSSFLFALYLFFIYDRITGGFQFVTRKPWLSELGISYWIGVDGISLSLLLLNGLVGLAGVLFSWNVTEKPNLFFSLYLLVVAGAAGVFQALDFFILFVFYELVIVPKYLLIAGWGSTRREYGAMKLTMYSAAGSAFVLLGMVAIWALGASRGIVTMGLPDMLPSASEYSNFTTPKEQLWLFPILFTGFAVLAGLWPLHTWAPTGHVAAPTAGSMLLAGVVMKLGAYGALRVPMSLLPHGLEAWRWFFAFLGAIGIIAGALAAMRQQDLKFVVGYSSIAHMGFVIVGLMTLSPSGLSGAVFQMVSHGIIGALLFAVVGRMIYERTHTRNLQILEQLGLSQHLPFAAGTFLLASLASMGMPGFSGFVAEICILFGTWQTMPILLILAGLGAAFTVAFTLIALKRSFFDTPQKTSTQLQEPQELSKEATPQLKKEKFQKITKPEIIGALLLLAATILLGLAPGILMGPITESLHGNYFEALFQEVTK
ncbi:MAG: NADH-quinone oxidoreductase subunit M [Chthoniobacterales bacterium]|nr:NADH-quinone oxidoreductase subunit M [Chthoniobacterales bacterium]